MRDYLRVVASDFDGTLTSTGKRPNGDVLTALTRVRAEGGLVILVTGRILSELRADYTDVDDHVDAIVAENGCVLSGSQGHRLLATPVDQDLIAALEARNINVRAGEVILAGRAADRAAVLEEIHRLELDCQLVFNRSEMMILPAGLTKGTGLYEALGDFGVSRHSTIGIGDAENDHSLLDVCEVGVAVGDAVTSLKSFADVVLKEPNGRGVSQLLSDIFQPDAGALHSQRWRLRLGKDRSGESATVPSSQMNMLICGESGAGKSRLAGLVAERLIAQGYCVLVVDPEGDHQGLGRLRGVVVLGSDGGLPHPERVASVFSQRFTSVVLDLSQVHKESHQPYLKRLANAIARSRDQTGLPHWVIDDEAHSTADHLRADSTSFGGTLNTGRWGFCLATFSPLSLHPDALANLDAAVALGSKNDPSSAIVDILARISGEEDAHLMAALARTGPGEAYLALRPSLGMSTTFTVADRATEHRRHRHKYTDMQLPRSRSFYFRDNSDTVVAVARNVKDLQHVLATCPAEVTEHHAAGRDISHWLSAVLSDSSLAEEVASLEAQVAYGRLSGSEAGPVIAECVRRSYAI